MISQRMFRNVVGSPTDPVATWDPEVFVSILAYGRIGDYDPVADEIRAHPWGEVARTVEEILDYTDPDDDEEPTDPGTHALFRAVIEDARRRAESAERRAVADELTRLLQESGLGAERFAARCGTSRSRLSTYLSGRVVPRATFLVRARRVAAETG